MLRPEPAYFTFAGPQSVFVEVGLPLDVYNSQIHGIFVDILYGWRRGQESHLVLQVMGLT